MKQDSIAKQKKKLRIFKALADPNRLAVLDLLKTGERCACVIQEALGMQQSRLSYHMKLLCESGLVHSRQEGKWTHYRLSREGHQEAIDLIMEITNDLPDPGTTVLCQSSKTSCLPELVALEEGR